jgi:hypothetical protein
VRSEWRLLAGHLTRATGGELLLDRQLDRSDPQLLQRRISAAENGSYATSSSAGPRP